MAPKAKAKVGARSRSATPTAAKAKAKGKAKAKANASRSTEDLAVMVWQVAARGFLGRVLLAELDVEKRKQEADMAEAIRAAGAAAIAADRRKLEAARKKEAEKRQKAKKLAEDTKKLLAAAFDGEISTVQKLLGQGLPINAADVLGTTALSEAAAGGHLNVAKLLVEKKADPNSQGEFKRTPAWRASYASHGDMIQLLLEAGGDPRITDDQGQMPLDVGSKDAILAQLRDWDLSKTDELVEDYQSWCHEEQLEAQFRQKEAMRSVDTEYEAAKKSHEAAQMMLAKAKSQMRNREKEFGVELAAGSQRARDACASADEELQRAEAEAWTAQTRFDAANVKRMAVAEECGVAAVLPGIEVATPALNDVLIRDLSGRIRSGSRWPLVIDPSDLAKKLLFYSGCAVLGFFHAEETDPERVRVALLSMIRAGGVLALDLSMFGAGIDLALLAEPFERLRPGLFERLCNRSLLTKPAGSRLEGFHELINKEEKTNRFRAEGFDDERTAKFKFIIVTSAEHPHKELLESFDVLRVSAAPGLDS